MQPQLLATVLLKCRRCRKAKCYCQEEAEEGTPCHARILARPRVVRSSPGSPRAGRRRSREDPRRQTGTTDNILTGETRRQLLCCALGMGPRLETHTGVFRERKCWSTASRWCFGWGGGKGSEEASLALAVCRSRSKHHAALCTRFSFISAGSPPVYGVCPADGCRSQIQNFQWSVLFLSRSSWLPRVSPFAGPAPRRSSRRPPC